jgi:hypothetical protein
MPRARSVRSPSSTEYWPAKKQRTNPASAISRAQAGHGNVVV